MKHAFKWCMSRLVSNRVSSKTPQIQVSQGYWTMCEQLPSIIGRVYVIAYLEKVRVRHISTSTCWKFWNSTTIFEAWIDNHHDLQLLSTTTHAIPHSLMRAHIGANPNQHHPSWSIHAFPPTVDFCTPWSQTMEGGLFPWSDLMVQLLWFDFLKNQFTKLLGKPNVDQEEWPCTKKGSNEKN